MKKFFLFWLSLLSLSYGHGQVSGNNLPETSQTIMPSKYIVMLYADQVMQKSGENQMMASHWKNTGGGRFVWQKEIDAGGDYALGISYASTTGGPGISVAIDSRDSISANLVPTSGYYSASADWSAFNVEQRQLPGRLHLSKGVHSISLALIAKSQAQETLIYSLCLIPVAKKKEIASDQALAEKQRPDTDWFARSGYGVMFHWTSQSMPEQGAQKPYAQAVQDFSVDDFVRRVVRTGAAYIILTTNHAEPYFPAPLTAWEKAYPGHTTHRDLVEEIADALAKNHIRLFLYMATHVYSRYDSVDDETFNRLNTDLITEIGQRYKSKVAGFWFDGWYQCYEKHPGFDFEKFYKICKTGNPDRLVALNSWLYPIVSCWQDYWAGEVYTLGKPAAEQILQHGPGRGMQSHDLVVMETENWLHTDRDTKIPPPHLKADDLARFILQSKGKGPVTINMQIYQDGRMGDEALAVMEQVKKIVRQ